MKGQSGIVRTNCVDCLDRTNAFQTKIAFIALKYMAQILSMEHELRTTELREIDKKQPEGTFMFNFKNIWADNGDYVSKIYTGTGATTSSTTRKGKGGVLGFMDHKMKSIGRYYLGKFEDGQKQRAINAILGTDTLDSSQGLPKVQIQHMEDQFTKDKKIEISILTWNALIPAKKINENLMFELFKKINLKKTDLFIVGLQDIIKLKLTNLFNPDNRTICDKWESQILNFLKGNYKNFERVNRDAYNGTTYHFEPISRHPRANLCQNTLN